jgi:hypothetical protein
MNLIVTQIIQFSFACGHHETITNTGIAMDDLFHVSYVGKHIQDRIDKCRPPRGSLYCD